MSTQVIVEPVGVVGTESSALSGVDDASDAYAVEHLAGFAEGSADDVPEDCEEGWCCHLCFCVELTLGWGFCGLLPSVGASRSAFTSLEIFMSLPLILHIFAFKDTHFKIIYKGTWDMSSFLQF